ncbi:MAG: hypothetical protein GXO23_06725 [Crenarchaeota archaeon]|nr:hypothetical protein [Thermoproteota archaeon]
MYRIIREKELGCIAGTLVGLGFLLFSIPPVFSTLLDIIRLHVSLGDVLTIAYLIVMAFFGLLIVDVSNEYRRSGLLPEETVVKTVTMFSVIIIFLAIIYLIGLPTPSIMTYIIDMFMVNTSTTTVLALIAGAIMYPIAANILINDASSTTGTVLAIIASCLSLVTGGALTILFVGVLIASVGNLIEILFGENDVASVVSRVLKVIGFITCAIFVIILGYYMTSTASMIGGLLYQIATIGGILMIVGGIVLCISVINLISMLFSSY